MRAHVDRHLAGGHMGAEKGHLRGFGSESVTPRAVDETAPQPPSSGARGDQSASSSAKVKMAWPAAIVTCWRPLLR